jgi:hypothetical protein
MASAGVAVAATEHDNLRQPLRRIGRIVLAACALPGVMLPAAHAEDAPERGVFEVKLSGYKEYQDSVKSGGTASGNTTQAASGSGNHVTVSAASRGGSTNTGSTSGTSSNTVSGASGGVNRISVLSPSVYALLPLGRRWSAEGSATLDEVSGASPSYYTDTAGFVHMKDRRRAGDLKLTRYFDRQVFSLGASSSSESDYWSKALSSEARFSTDDQNTTVNLGVGLTRDRISSNNGAVTNANKRTNEYQIGVTQAVNADDLVQLNYTRSLSSGYLSDPYKSYDRRPELRNAHILQLRWNHWLGGAALKTGYRYYQDTYGIRAHTVDLALAVPFADGLTFTPAVRYYTQSAAAFYVNPVTSSPTYPAPADQSGYYSLDQRVSAFGAGTVGGKIEWPIGSEWTLDTKLDYYRQASSLRLLGQGSPGLAPLNAFIWQIGLKRPF